MFDILPALGSGFALLLLGPLLLPALALVYIGLRLRDLRGNNPDPEVGIKAAYHFFLSLGVLFVLIGLTIITNDIMDGVYGWKPKPSPTSPFRDPNFGPGFQQTEDEFFNVNKRTGLGVVLAGALCGVFFLMLLLAGTNDRKFPHARRAFVGLRFAVCGVVVLGVITSFMIAVLQKDPDVRVFEVLTALIIVWGPAALVHLGLLRLYSSSPTRPRTVELAEPETRSRSFD
jgi:hypothetical protein